jgi:hypothetical protein
MNVTPIPRSICVNTVDKGVSGQTGVRTTNKGLKDGKFHNAPFEALGKGAQSALNIAEKNPPRVLGERVPPGGWRAGCKLLKTNDGSCEKTAKRGRESANL